MNMALVGSPMSVRPLRQPAFRFSRDRTLFTQHRDVHPSLALSPSPPLFSPWPRQTFIKSPSSESSPFIVAFILSPTLHAPSLKPSLHPPMLLSQIQT